MQIQEDVKKATRRSTINKKSPPALAIRVGDYHALVNFKGEIIASFGGDYEKCFYLTRCRPALS